ncbi:hypothetical protein [Amycolatopsis sp. NPDC051903]|uniref:hypothetical protein n=1 Tax=Amycolatopsis sp. NPDC051903 TaxID=3363936 RepID=UPI0037A6BC0B
MIRFFADTFGPSQLVLGTDAPRVRAGDWASRVATVPGLSDAERNGIMHSTAESLGIGGQAK